MIKIFDQPQHQIAGLLKDGAPVWMTVNPVEYHGPHLSLHNDLLVSRGIVRAMQEGPLLMADDLEVGVNPAPGPGSRHTPYSVVKQLVRDACARLAELGAQRVIIMTFHGDPLHAAAIDAGVRELRTRGVKAVAPFNALMHEMLRLDPRAHTSAVAHLAKAQQEEVLSGLQHDFHAGFFETSVAMHFARPESVSEVHKTLPPCPPMWRAQPFRAARAIAGAFGATALANELDFAAHAVAWKQIRPFPGYTGHPAYASKEAGAHFADVMLRRFHDAIDAVFMRDERGPQPIMPWTVPLSLGGRVVV